MQIDIRLPQGAWKYFPTQPLGKPGGFGAVFAGESPDRSPVAVKRLHLDAAQAGRRELAIAAELIGERHSHIVPIYGAGLDENEQEHYYLVMAKAEHNLADVISQNVMSPPLAPADVLYQIAVGLSEASVIVHRDIKPANILMHEGKWKIADFGISKFIEDATSLLTLRGALSPPYAAPEQWLNTRATGATDIYALGCVAHAIVTGKPPFVGSSMEEYREQHVNVTPKPLAGIHPGLAMLVSKMLVKDAAMRPSLSLVLSSLKAIVENRPIEKAEQQFWLLGPQKPETAESVADADRVRLSVNRQAWTILERFRLAKEGTAQLREHVISLLCTYIECSRIKHKVVDHGVIHATGAVGTAKLGFAYDDNPVEANSFPLSKWDVLASAKVSIEHDNDLLTRSASLWYMKPQGASDYRWYEVLYRSSKDSGRPPYDLHGQFRRADRAASSEPHQDSIAYGPEPVDIFDVMAFVERWYHYLQKVLGYNTQDDLSDRQLMLRSLGMAKAAPKAPLD